MKKVEPVEEKVLFPDGQFSVAHRRWLVREIESGRMTINSAVATYDFKQKDPDRLIRYWMKRYSSEIPLTLPLMSEKDRQKAEALEKRLKELEKQLEYAQMKNVALETLIDVAEDQLKIKIRKKSGPKQ